MDEFQKGMVIGMCHNITLTKIEEKYESGFITTSTGTTANISSINIFKTAHDIIEEG